MSAVYTPVTSSKIISQVVSPPSMHEAVPVVGIVALMAAIEAAFAARDIVSLSVNMTALLIAGPALNAPGVLSRGTSAPVADMPTLARLRKTLLDPWTIEAPCIELDAACLPWAAVVMAVPPAPPPPSSPPRRRHDARDIDITTPRTSAVTSAALPSLFI